MPPVYRKCPLIDREGVVKMGDDGDVPRVAGHGACQEGGGVVNEVGDNCFHKVLREPGDWRRMWGRCLQRISGEVPLDFGLASVPELFGEQFDRYSSVGMMSEWMGGEKLIVRSPVNEDVGVFSNGIVDVQVRVV